MADGVDGGVGSVGNDGGAPGAADSVGGEGADNGVSESQAAEFDTEIEMAQAQTQEQVAQVTEDEVAPQVSQQVGYGNMPGGVSIRDLDDLSEEEVQAKVNAHIDEYNQTTVRSALDQALDLSVAYRAQGGTNIGFDTIKDRFNVNSREYIEAVVAERRADLLASASGNIQALNNTGVNYGAELYETLRAIANASEGVPSPTGILGVPAPEDFVLQTMINHEIQYGRNPSAVDGIRTTAFTTVMNELGYGQLWGAANRSLANKTAADLAERRRELSEMDFWERLREAASDAQDRGIGGPRPGHPLGRSAPGH